MEETIVILVVLLLVILLILAALGITFWWLEKRQRRVAQREYDNLWTSRQPSPSSSASTDGHPSDPIAEFVIKS